MNDLAAVMIAAMLALLERIFAGEIGYRTYV